MSKAMVDPGELRRFAADLKRFNNDLKADMSAIHHRFIRLAETWQDQEQAKFAELFEQMMRMLVKFADAADKEAPLLLRKADRIQEYLDQR